MAIGLCSSSYLNLCLTDFWVTSIEYTLCKSICDLAFVAVFCSGEALDILDNFDNLSIVYYTFQAGCVII